MTDWCSAGFEQAVEVSKQGTEVISHPVAGDPDDRQAFASAAQPIVTAPSAVLVGGPDYDAEPDVIDSGATREVGIQVLCNDSNRIQVLCNDCDRNNMRPQNSCLKLVNASSGMRC